MSESSSGPRRLVAVAGKGGTGKTAGVALMARFFSERPETGRLLLIDADPAGGLQSALGVKVRRTMGELREEIIKTARGSDADAKAELAEKIEYLAFEALTEQNGFAVLAMGRTETMGCFCPVNALLRDAIGALSKSFDTILIDGEAGLEQVNRQVVRRVDTLLVISDPTARGIETAEMIKRMVEVDKAMSVERLGLVFNRVRDSEDVLRESAARIGIEVFGMVPYDATLAEFDLVGTPITDLPADSPGLAAYQGILSDRVLSNGG